jgi:hypothetical protein
MTSFSFGLMAAETAPSIEDLEDQLAKKSAAARNNADASTFRLLAGKVYTRESNWESVSDDGRCAWQVSVNNEIRFKQPKNGLIEYENLAQLTYMLTRASKIVNCQPTHSGVHRHVGSILRKGNVWASKSTLVESRCTSGECRATFGGGSSDLGESSDAAIELLLNGERLIFRWTKGKPSVYQRR